MSEEFEGFVPPTKNYFPMPNEWINISAKITNLAELKVIEYVLRHTWGYQEYGITKTISVDEFCHGRRRQDRTRMDNGTGLSEPSVKAGLKRAIKHGYLVCEVDDKDQGRVKKSYALKNKEGGKKVTPQESYPVGILPPGGKEVTPREQESYPRSEKDTRERHLEKDTKVRITSSPSLDVDAHAFVFHSGESIFYYHQTCVQAQPSAFEDMQAFQELALNLIPARAQCTLCYGSVFEPPIIPTRTELETDVKQVMPEVQAEVALRQAQRPSEKGADEEQVAHIAPLLQHGGAASANLPGGPRAPEGKTKRKTQQQDGIQALAPEIERILGDWDAIMKRPTPRTQKQIEAATTLLASAPTREELDAVRKFCFASNREWYGKRGVKLSDIATNFSSWQSLQDMPAPTQRGRESPEDFTSKTLDKERNDRRIQEMIEQSKKIRAEREAAQAATK